jgi:membrane-bound ClpP family serine protease
MKTSHIIITAYVVIAILFGIYGSLFGDYDYRGFMYNLGRGLVWPTIIFPSLGKIIGGIILLAVIGGALIFSKKQ